MYSLLMRANKLEAAGVLEWTERKSRKGTRMNCRRARAWAIYQRLYFYHWLVWPHLYVYAALSALFVSNKHLQSSECTESLLNAPSGFTVEAWRNMNSFTFCKLCL